MAFRILPNTKRGEFTGDGKNELRRFRGMAARIRRIGRRNPERGAALAKRFRAQLAKGRGGGANAVLPTDVRPSGRRRARSDRTEQREAAMGQIRVDTRRGAGGASPF